MNTFLQDNLFTIIIFLLLIILVLIALIGFVMVKLLFQKKELNETLNEARPKEILSKTATYKILSEESVVEKYFCHNHPEDQSIGSCLICEEVFCENCLIEHDGLYFCKEHFRIFASNKWKQITDIKTTPDTPIDGLYIYHFKRKIWQERNAPIFILTHYKINIESDFIESFIQLNVLEKDAERLEKELEIFQADHH